MTTSTRTAAVLLILAPDLLDAFVYVCCSWRSWDVAWPVLDVSKRAHVWNMALKTGPVFKSQRRAAIRWVNPLTFVLRSNTWLMPSAWWSVLIHWDYSFDPSNPVFFYSGLITASFYFLRGASRVFIRPKVPLHIIIPWIHFWIMSWWLCHALSKFFQFI